MERAVAEKSRIGALDKQERVNVIATVVEKLGVKSLLLDDGSGKVEVRSFSSQDLFENIMVGDVVLIIGRPRQHEGTLYLVAEIARRLGGVQWLQLRQAELGPAPIAQRAAPAPLPASQEIKPELLIKSIKELDSGSGAAVEEVVAKLGSGAETMITNLMAEGEVFEIKPGRVKVLE